MEIFINGVNIEYIRETEKTIGEILGSLESACEKAGMTITGIRVDNDSLDAGKLDDLFPKSPESVLKIELDTINGDDVQAMMRDLGAEFTNCVEPLLEVPVQLQTGKELMVMETINRFSVQLQNLYRLLPLLPLTGFAPGEPRVASRPLAEIPGVLSPVLEELLEALKCRDTIMVGDLSEYELAPKIEELGAVLSTVGIGGK